MPRTTRLTTPLGGRQSLPTAVNLTRARDLMASRGMRGKAAALDKLASLVASSRSAHLLAKGAREARQTLPRRGTSRGGPLE